MADGSAALPMPNPAAVLSNYQRVSNDTTSTAVLTIPAGRTWVGTVSVMSSSQSATAVLVETRVVTAGTGVLPAAGTIIGAAQSSRDATTTVVTVPNVVIVAPPGNSVTLNLINGSATTYIGAISAFGYLVG